MKAKVLAAIFALAVTAQLWVPASMILSSEKALESGKSFKFKTAPVDPYDAFRGKYVALDFDVSMVDSAPGTEKCRNHKKVYALIAEDSNGFAKVVGLRAAKPVHGYFVKVKVDRMYGRTAIIQFPFSMFFLEEGKAEKAERLYRERDRRGKQDSYAIVMIGSNGHAVIKDLVVGGIPVREASK
jgi:uncharacterized membrane-anchored protein